MAKSDYYTSSQGYTDDDNQLRNFTFIDHDRKTTVVGEVTKEEISQAKKELLDYREKTLESILAISASYCPQPFTDFLIRGEGHEVISWNETMLRDSGVPLNRLRDLQTLLNNRIKIYQL